MINLSIKHGDLPIVAEQWYEDLWSFLTKYRKGNKILHYSSMKFNKTFKKLYCIFNESCATYALSQKQITLAKGYLYKFIKALKKNIATPDNIEYWAKKQEDIKRNHPEIIEVWKTTLIPLYESFSHEVAYKYLTQLNLRTCPYCNRQYTFTIRKGGDETFHTRPEYDHFFDKSSYPLLALSFYNLVPSCHDCNHGKSTKSSGINPFFDGFSAKFVIAGKDGRRLNKNEIARLNDPDEFSVEFDYPSDDEKQNIATFGLREQYNEHKDYVQEMIDKSVAYNSVMQQGIVDSFQGTFQSAKDVYHFVWGHDLGLAEQENRPLSKLTADILEQLGIK